MVEPVKKWIFWMGRRKPKTAKKVSFFRLMAITQKAWLWIRESLMTLRKSENQKNMQVILDDIILRINQWMNISSALEAHSYFFSFQEIQLIKSSEAMWNLPETLNNIATESENHQKLIWKIKWAMTYPIVILVMSFLASIAIITFVIPWIVKFFPPDLELPLLTRIMLWAKDFFVWYWYFLLWVFLMIFLWTPILYKQVLSFKIIADQFFLNAPVAWNLVKKFNLYRFSKLLGDFYNAWVSPNVALKQIQWVLWNYHYKKKIGDVKKDIEVWLSFTESMEWSTLFDPILIQIIGVWESAWNIWEVLEKISEFYRDEIDMQIEQMMKLIEPLLMVFVAIIIWVIVAAVFLPLMDLAAAITG